MFTSIFERSAAASYLPCINDACREFVEKLAVIVGANMAKLGRQRAASAAAGSGKAAVYDLEKKLAELEAGTVLEPYTGEDLKESLKASEVCIIFCHWPLLLLVTIPCVLNKFVAPSTGLCALNNLVLRFLQAALQNVMHNTCPDHGASPPCCMVRCQIST